MYSAGRAVVAEAVQLVVIALTGEWRKLQSALRVQHFRA